MEYMDLHILKPECGIEIHRHRDNQEIFFVLKGAGVMVTGDWCQFPTREAVLRSALLQLEVSAW
jgi:mannose-6-phosphate isomerase-like protein (cupin superfamily)